MVKKLTVKSGISVEKYCGSEMHPVSAVNYVRKMIERDQDELVVFTNSTDVVMAAKYIGKKNGVETEFFLDGISHGNDTEPLFADLNRSLDLINEFGATED